MIKKLKEGIYNVGAVDFERTLFDEIVPLPQGTSYNAYLVMGKDKTALIDTVEPDMAGELFKNLDELGVDRIDYVVSNHAEQDHSGSIPLVLERFPGARVVTNKKCMAFEQDLLHMPEEVFTVIDEGDEIDLGGRTLTFVMTKWVHWPETMTTILKEDRVAFTCDFFGSHVATSHVFAEQCDRTFIEAKRYYAEIMMPFRATIVKNIEKVEQFAPAIIAPSHGPAFSEPSAIINAYKEWVGPGTKNEALVLYTSMHGSTRKMVDALVNDLAQRGVGVRSRDMVTSDFGEVAIDLVDLTTLIIATPTMLAGPHPKAVYAAYLANALRPKLQLVGVIGSFGWGGKTVDILKANMGNIRTEFLDPVLVKGLPRDEDYQRLEALADRVRAKHVELGVLK